MITRSQDREVLELLTDLLRNAGASVAVRSDAVPLYDRDKSQWFYMIGTTVERFDTLEEAIIWKGNMSGML